MARANKTRDGQVAQKKGVCVMTIPYVEADILVDGSVYGNLPPRSLVTRITRNTLVASGTASATIDVVVNGVVAVNEVGVTSTGVADPALVDASRYVETGGEVVVKAGATTPADGALVGEIYVEYIELDKNTGEYTKHLDS